MIKTHLICRLLRCIHSCESFHFLPHLLTRLSSAPHPSTLPSPLDTFWKDFFGANISCLPFNQTASVITNLTRMFGDVFTFRDVNIDVLSCLLGMLSETYFWKLSLKGVPTPHLLEVRTFDEVVFFDLHKPLSALIRTIQSKVLTVVCNGNVGWWVDLSDKHVC